MLVQLLAMSCCQPARVWVFVQGLVTCTMLLQTRGAQMSATVKWMQKESGAAVMLTSEQVSCGCCTLGALSTHDCAAALNSALPSGTMHHPSTCFQACILAWMLLP